MYWDISKTELGLIMESFDTSLIVSFTGAVCQKPPVKFAFVFQSEILSAPENRT